MRWTPGMAEAMLRLRAIYLSGDFGPYWDLCQIRHKSHYVRMRVMCL